MATLKWTEETVFNEPHSGVDAYFNQMRADIARATKSIYFEVYIFEQDELGLETLNLFAMACERGVKVKLVLDGVGSSGWTFSNAEVWRKKGIDLQFYHPLAWQKSFKKVWQSLSFKKIALGYSKFKHRNHRKICLIDDEILFVGSMNVSKCHLLGWRDCAVRVKGEDAKNFVYSLSQSWRANHELKKTAHREFLKKMQLAQKKIWITNPYFLPDLRFMRALSDASRRGVDIKILLPQRSDLWWLKFAIEGLYAALFACGIKIYEYTPSILHAKIFILDDEVSVGSSNLDYLSLFHNLEADISLSHEHNIQQVQNRFSLDLQESQQIDAQSWNKRSWVNQCLEWFFLLFRKIL